MRRLIPSVDSGRPASLPAHGAWITVAFTYQGLEALGVPQESLDSFAPEFRQGMAARADELGDVGESSPANWEHPLGTGDVHVAIAALSPDAEQTRSGAGAGARAHSTQLPGVELIWRQDCYQLPTGRTSFGFKDGIGQPAVEGIRHPLDQSARAAAEGRRDHPRLPRRDRRPASRCRRRRCSAATAPTSCSASSTPESRRTASYLRERAASREEEALLGAKMVGRWQSGAPLAVSPDETTRRSEQTAPQQRLLYGDDPRGFKCPVGSHARRANPRDAFDGDGSVDVRLHRMIRRGTSYGPMLPDGVLEDDGVDRGIMFVFAGAHLKRQFEFVKTQWLNDGIFIGAPAEKDPLVGAERRHRHPHDSAAADPAPTHRACRRSW